VAEAEKSLILLTSEERGARAPRRRTKTRKLQHRHRFRPDHFLETSSTPTTPRIKGTFSEMTAHRDDLCHNYSDFPPLEGNAFKATTTT
jgi:hypothetical protein